MIGDALVTSEKTDPSRLMLIKLISDESSKRFVIQTKVNLQSVSVPGVQQVQYRQPGCVAVIVGIAGALTSPETKAKEEQRNEGATNAFERHQDVET